jgi:hypothetical protein
VSDLDHRRPAPVPTTVDWEQALRYLQLNPRDPKAQALVLVCDRYSLDPLLGHISLYEGKPYIHYAGYLHMANGDSQYDGSECVREWEDDDFYYATVRVHRKDRAYAFERTGRSRKVKAKRAGGTYRDEFADAKAFAQAHRRALRLAFNVAAPDPDDDAHREVAAPEPVVEVARMVDPDGPLPPAPGSTPTSEAGEREPGLPLVSASPRDRRDDPASDPTSGPRPGERLGPDPLSGEGERVGTSTGSTERRDDPSPDPTYRRHGTTETSYGVSPDPTSAPPGWPYPVDRFVDPNPTDADAKEGDAIPDIDEGLGSAVDIGGQPSREAVADSAAGPDPSPSLVQAWCDENNIPIRQARFYLRKGHPKEFDDLKDWRDLQELEGERAALAVKRLDQWMSNAKVHEKEDG